MVDETVEHRVAALRETLAGLSAAESVEVLEFGALRGEGVSPSSGGAG